MSDCIKVSIDADVGATLISPNFFSIEELVPPRSTIAEIEEGILNGTYTPIDPNLYTYEGLVKLDYGQPVVNTLTITIETVTIEGLDELGNPISTDYDVVVFKILPEDTMLWDNKTACLLFDIKRTEIADPTNIDIWVKGKINVCPVITE
ncbi:hypothetical protein NVP1152O_011 [Vibrio phage 1.152.O._10N.222.46.E1]|uniref:Uncharacterized protein n=5 Tax=Nahantvirus 49C7 TaxID=2846601 RepID=A0A2I7RB80_9CAUD|nr:hypothetical protein HYP57_gp011 [Vibrio phage 1.026.O._10N.222.49.C7]AUR82494.1 hypothetical protein NVP1025O_011 [Vibrio phage 1.025.O._10N.222.46.B6]AUR90744.1 hypothetical protein NVP1150O_011 [Vibrio phage 1.150.O._10N.222.46.A6]AUR90916.1 hypothetical protein NVP1152O_011 [Vibrio phage 1.152.O._10N.222.46.E1]AUS02385.1 hypothetical protein NVP2130O_011 [Vibrio phage 2.130.O._10N.222.46.C2]AUR82602.1 hypothetical protein NVP1026O_011 [Vibrio phage 1.026.O._10N.222.49.C7]